MFSSPDVVLLGLIPQVLCTNRDDFCLRWEFVSAHFIYLFHHEGSQVLYCSTYRDLDMNFSINRNDGCLGWQLPESKSEHVIRTLLLEITRRM